MPPHPLSSLDSRQRLLFGVSICVLCITLYFLALQFLFPGYFHPLTPFHTDFYDYTATASVRFRDLARFPRPVSFAVMWLFGSLGVRGLMAGGIVISLCGIILTIAFVARLISYQPKHFLLFSIFYLVLIFGHPQFYFEHRHDLPAEVSYLGLMLALHAWLSWAHSRHVVAAACTVLALAMFAFSKETFFLSAPCLAVGLLVYDRKQWRAHLSFLLVLLILEAASVWWNRHVGSPFVNPGAEGADPYRIDLSPASIAKLYWHYLRLLLMPAGAVLLALSLFLISKFKRRESVLAVAFAAAGLAALVPHALLPNHVIDEYAWIPAPLLWVPLLLASGALQSRKSVAFWGSAVAVLTVLTYVGHYGYLHDYRSTGLRWYVSQERRTENFVRSWPKLRALPGGSRVLIAGLDTPFLPWSSIPFTETTFGHGKLWRVVVKELPPSGPPSWMISFSDLPALLGQSAMDYAASYDEAGTMTAVRTAADLRALSQDPWEIVPQLAAVRRELARHPNGHREILAALAEAAEWGDQETGRAALDAAREADMSGDTWVCFFRAKLAASRSDWAEAVAGFSCASAQEPKAAIFRDALENARQHLPKENAFKRQ